MLITISTTGSGLAIANGQKPTASEGP